MSTYQYRVIPAPTKGVKAKGLKTPESRFANSLEGLLNDMANDGWEYQRAETLPSIERSGLTGSTTEWRNMLVFRKPVESFTSEVIDTPVMAAAEAEDVAQEAADTLDEVVQDHATPADDAPEQRDS